MPEGTGLDRVRVDVLVDRDDRRAALHEATHAGLHASPKHVPSIWLYDEEGSLIFEEITRLPDYYLTRREREILEAHAQEIAALTQADTLVELGSGTSEKTRLLLDALLREGSLRCFAPLDVSEETLVASAHQIAVEYPSLGVHAIVGDFERHLSAVPDGDRRLVAFLGSTIGNLVPEARGNFVRTISDVLGGADALLLGLDLVKEPERVEAAYNDATGVSERFQRNALAHLDRELGSTFAAARFEYEARWDAAHEWVDLGFRSAGVQVVPVPGLGIEVTFADRERLRIEVSSKFRLDRLAGELARADLTVARWWTDRAGDFAVGLIVARDGDVGRELG